MRGEAGDFIDDFLAGDFSGLSEDLAESLVSEIFLADFFFGEGLKGVSSGLFSCSAPLFCVMRCKDSSLVSAGAACAAAALGLLFLALFTGVFVLIFFEVGSSFSSLTGVPAL